MNLISQHVPPFVELGDTPTKIGIFQTVEQLFNISWVKRLTNEPHFCQFSVNGNRLMAEYRGGREWWVVGFFSHPVTGLPTWDGGIYEVYAENGEPTELPGHLISYTKGDEVGLKDGRVLQRRNP